VHSHQTGLNQSLSTTWPRKRSDPCGAPHSKHEVCCGLKWPNHPMTWTMSSVPNHRGIRTHRLQSTGPDTGIRHHWHCMPSLWYLHPLQSLCCTVQKLRPINNLAVARLRCQLTLSITRRFPTCRGRSH
jgi:hypothetical protein